MKTNTSDYALTIILFIMTPDNEAYLVVFHFYTLILLSLTIILITRNFLLFSKHSESGNIT